MLRSFSYASSVAADHATTERPVDRHHLGPLVHTWEKRVSEVFLKNYHDTIQGCAVWPTDPGAAERLIDFFIIDKALYELRYEMDSRPDWLAIPLFSLLRTFQPQEGIEVLIGDNS
jgi:maltose alpha-D-glucosyltransferase/alpha-amylase